MSCGTSCVAACLRCECLGGECRWACPLRGAEHRLALTPSLLRRSSVSVAPVDFGAPPAPRPAWLAAVARQLADAPAAEVLAWAVATFGSDLTVASSMQDGVL